MPAVDSTFGTFANGGDAQSTDIVVGLRNGLNYRFSLSGIVGAFLPLAGGTMSGDIDMAGNTITDVPTPGGSSDVVPKSYVDGLTAGTALTSFDDTNVTLTLGGSPTTALLHAASLTLGWTGQLALSRGGTNANLTAANGGIVYSTASALGILTPAASSVLVTDVSNIPSLSTVLPGGLTTTDPTLTFGIATKNYVDKTALTGTSVYAASAGSLGTVTQSGSGAGATITNAGVQATFALDAVNPPAGSNVLIKNTAVGMTSANEGIYEVTSVGSGATNWVLTRASSYDTATEINRTGLIIILNGSTLVGEAWYNSSTIVTVDTTAFNYSQFSNITFPVTLVNGGTGASLVASNGGIFYSTATAGAILAGTATANKMLLSGSTAPPTWSTSTIPTSAGATAGKSLFSDGTNYVLSSYAFPTSVGATGTLLRSDGTNYAATTTTYPNTNAVNTLLYASSANVMAALATANSGVLVTDVSGVPSISSNLPAAINLPASFKVNTTTVTTTGTQLNLLNGLTVVPINKVVIQTFTSTGTYTPTTGMVYCIVRMVAGGGGGGGTANSTASNVSVAAGGGGGEYGEGVFTAATIGASQAVTIGDGGTAGANTGTAGGTGGTTSLGALLTAIGGNGGTQGTNNTVAIAPSAVGGTGGTGGSFHSRGSDSACGFGLGVLQVGFSGAGGGSLMGGNTAAPTIFGSTGTAGTAGRLYGSGASGAASANAGGAAVGGVGAKGFVEVIEYISA